MLRSMGGKRAVAAVAGLSIVLSTVSCGTILHPERRGQPGGRLDAGIVVLDAVGLLLFFVPGVIAFAVDFSNGTIYLPPDQYGDARLPQNVHDLQTVRMSPAELTPQRIETLVKERTGQTIHLEDGTYRAAKLTKIEDLSPASLENLQSSPASARVNFEDKARE